MRNIILTAALIGIVAASYASPLASYYQQLSGAQGLLAGADNAGTWSSVGLDTGLVSYWSMDNVDGTNVINEVAGGNNGWITGTPDFGTNYGIRANGVQTVAASSESILATATITNFPFTISAWLKAASGDQAICGIGNAGSGSYYHDILSTGVDATLVSRGTTARTSTYNYPTTRSNHVHLVGVFVSDIERYLYVDGVLRLSETDDCGVFALNTNNRLFCGVNRASSPTYCTGSLDEVAYWNIALTSNDVVNLYNGGAGLFK